MKETGGEGGRQQQRTGTLHAAEPSLLSDSGEDRNRGGEGGETSVQTRRREKLWESTTREKERVKDREREREGGREGESVHMCKIRRGRRKAGFLEM